jgi:calcium-dependent protein kinase
MQMFNSMDKDSSGHLSKEEVLQGLKQVCMDLSDQDYESLLKELDANLSGVVDYTEFVAAIMSRQQLLSRERLEQVFQVFDRDGSGDITAAELKAVLGQSEEKWAKVIAQVDQNQDGKIDLKEFKNLMLSFLS